MRLAPLNRIVPIVALLLAAPMHLAQAQGADPDAVAITSVVRAYHIALKAGDAQAVSRLLAPDAVILEGGDRETRAEYLEHHLQADIEFAQAVPTRHGEMDVIVNGEVAWAISTSVTQGTYQTKPVSLAGAELMVLSKTPAGWVIRSIHWSSRSSK
jgi:ketosteroid isomerase-like protein